MEVAGDGALPPLTPASIPSAVDPHVCGAGMVRGVQVERATVRTNWTPWVASARLCLGRWQTGWELPTPFPQPRRSPLPPGAGRSPAEGIALLVENPSTRSFIVAQDSPTRGQHRQLEKGSLASADAGTTAAVTADRDRTQMLTQSRRVRVVAEDAPRPVELWMPQFPDRRSCPSLQPLPCCQ